MRYTVSKLKLDIDQLASQLNVADFRKIIIPGGPDVLISSDGLLPATATAINGGTPPPVGETQFPFGREIGLSPAVNPMFVITPPLHWVMVGILMPIVIALYLLLILLCYYLFCKRDASQWNDSETVAHESNSGQLDGSFTPPPSYAIFVGSGESSMIPPSYKMLYPANSMDSQQTTFVGNAAAVGGECAVFDPSHLMSLSNSLLNLNATPRGASPTPVPPPTTALTTVAAAAAAPAADIKIVVPLDQIHFVCETPNGALNIFNQFLHQGVHVPQQGVFTPSQMPRSGSEDILSTSDIPIVIEKELLPTCSSSPQRIPRGSSF